MKLAIEKKFGGQTAEPRGTEGGNRVLELTVVFTSPEATVAALEKAGALAESLNASITLLVPQVVPYPLPLASPPVLIDFNERRYRGLADQSKVEISVRLYLCRDRWDALACGLGPRSIVVLGVRRRWWPTPETHLARRLRRAGYDVILTETE